MSASPNPVPASDRVAKAPLLVLGIVLAWLLAAKLAYDPNPHGHVDPQYYYGVAQSVAAGEGLKTKVSLYHQGLREFPAPTSIYPAWPWLLGMAGRVLGLERAAALLPELFFFVDVLLIYLLAVRLFPGPANASLLDIRGRPLLHAGHVAVVLLGLNALFFLSTSFCGTEAIGFAFLLASLLLFREVQSRSPALFGAGSVALATVGFLCRSQFALLPPALIAVMVALAFTDRRYVAAALAGLAAWLALTIPWIVHLAGLPGEFNARMVLDFTAYRQTPELPPFAGFAQYDSLGARLADALRGLLVSVDPTSRHSYGASFGYAFYAVLCAAAVLVVRTARGRRDVRSFVRPESHLALATLAAALACLLPVHAMHGDYPREWYFSDRHGLPVVLLIVLAYGHAGTWNRWARTAALLAVLTLPRAATVLRFPFDRQLVDAHLGLPAQLDDAENELVNWLNEHPSPPVCVSKNARELALWSDAGFHWVRCESKPAETLALFEHLQPDYLIVYANERRCAFAQVPEGRFELAQRFGTPGGLYIDVFVDTER